MARYDTQQKAAEKRAIQYAEERRVLNDAEHAKKLTERVALEEAAKRAEHEARLHNKRLLTRHIELLTSGSPERKEI